MWLYFPNIIKTIYNIQLNFSWVGAKTTFITNERKHDSLNKLQNRMVLNFIFFDLTLDLVGWDSYVTPHLEL